MWYNDAFWPFKRIDGPDFDFLKIQHGEQPPFQKKKMRYLRNGLTDLNELLHDDAH